MQIVRRLSRHAGLLLSVAAAVIVVLCLIGFGSAHQGSNSDMILSMPSLWFSGLFILPVIFFVLLGWVWKRFDRIVR